MRGILLLTSVCLLVGFADAWPEEKEANGERTVQVTGVGVVERKPDQAGLLLAVETFEATAEQATRQNAAKMAQVFKKLKKMALPENGVRTVSYNLTPRYESTERRKEEPKIIGFVAQNMVEVTVEPAERAGEVIDAATGAGANRIASLKYQLKAPEDARKDALRKAVANARAQAEALVDAAGQKLGPPLRISTSGDIHGPENVFDHRRALFSRAAAPTPVEAGTVRITVRVDIAYRLEDVSSE